MSDPINYGAGLTPANPALAFQQGFGQAQGIQQIFDARVQLEAQKQQAAMTEALRQKVVSGQATGAERADFLTRLAPEQTKAYQSALQDMDAEVKQQGLTGLGKIYAAFAAGNPEVAIQGLQERAMALRNSGNDEGAKLLETAVELEKTSPGQGSFFVANQLALLGKDGQDVLDSINKNLAAPGERGLTKAQEALAWAQAAKAGLGGDLTPEADKIINMATDSVSSSLLLAQQAENLAASFDKNKPVGGWTSQALESFKRAAGTQDAFTSLRQEYTKLRNTDVLKNLPPGVASDKDIEIALAAFPKEDANPEQISSFLKGMAKLQRYSAEVNKARAEWVVQNGNLGPSRSNITVGGEPVGKGTSFWDFTASIPIPNVAPGANTGATPPEPVKVKFGASTSTARPTATPPKKTVEVEY